jgi:hypothetical protein
LYKKITTLALNAGVFYFMYVEMSRFMFLMIVAIVAVAGKSTMTG